MKLNIFPKGKKGEDWVSPSTLVIIILALLLGVAFLFLILKLGGKLAP